MPTNKVIDLSHHNIVPESFEPAFASGVRGVIHKATEGSGFADAKADARFYLANQARMLWGLYHFLRPGNMKTQAQFFWNQAQAISNENTLLAADHEDPGVSIGNLIEWLEWIKDYSGRSPVIYSGHVLKDQLAGVGNAEISKYRLWLAQYSSKPTLPPGFTNYYLWQYTDSGGVAGIQPPTDCNDFQWSDEDLRKTWAGNLGPHPKPEPPAPDGEISITIPANSITISIPKDAITISIPRKDLIDAMAKNLTREK